MAETLTVQITAKDGATQVFKAVASNAQNVGEAVENAGKQGKKGMDDLGRSAEENADRMSRLRAEATAIGAVFGVVASAAIKAGAAYKDQRLDVQSLQDQYGTAADEILNFTEVMQDSLNTSNDAARDVALTFATLFRNYEMTETQIQSLMERTADIASARGRNAVEVSQMIQNALRGEAEYIEQIGVTLNETFVASEYAARGLGNWNTLTDEAAKAQFRYVLLLEQTADTQGRAAEEAQRAGGQFREFINEVQDGAQAFGEFLGPVGEVAAEMAPIAMALPVVTAGVGNLATSLRNSRTAMAALGMAFNPVTLGLAALTVTGIATWNMFQEGRERAERLEDALISLGDVATNLRLGGRDQEATFVTGFIADLEEAQQLSKEWLNDLDLMTGLSQTRAMQGGYQWEIDQVYELQEAYELGSDHAVQFADAQTKIGAAFADSRVDHAALNAELDRLHQQFLAQEITLDEYADGVIDIATNIDRFRVSIAAATTDISALRSELDRLINSTIEGGSSIDTMEEAFGFFTQGVEDGTVSATQLRAILTQLDRELYNGAITWEEYEAAVIATAQGLETAGNAGASLAASLDNVEFGLEEGDKSAAQFTETLGKMVEEAQAAEEALNAAGAAAGAFAVEYSTEFAQLTEDFISGILDIANIDMADKVNMAGLGTDATQAAAAINDVGSALDSVLTIYGAIDAMGQRMSQAGGIVDALFGPDGDPSDGVGPLRDVYDALLIDEQQFQQARLDGIAIQDAAAESELYLNKIRADQLPLLRETTEAYNEQIQAIANMDDAQEQMVALGWMDSGMQGRVEQFTEMISLMNNFGEDGAAAMQQVIDGIVATDPVLTAMLEDLGLIEQQLDGSYELSLDAEGAVSDIERLTASIDALTLALGGTPPSYDIDVKGIEDLEDAQALIDAMNDNDVTVNFGVTGVEDAKTALRNALGIAGGGEDGGDGVTVPVNLQLPTDLPPLPEPAPVEIPVTFYAAAATEAGSAAGGALSGLLGDGEDGLTIDYTINAFDNATDVINEVQAAADALPESETVDVSAPGATGATAELNAVTAAANAIPEIEVISVVASGATEAANALNAVAAAANSIPSTVNTTVTTTIRTINLGTDNNVLPGGRHGGMPGYAMGGVLFEGGEAGLELAHLATGGVVPLPRHAIYSAPRGTYIEPANSVGPRSTGGISVHVTVQGNVYGIDDLTAAVTRQLAPALADEFSRHITAHSEVMA